MGKTVQCDAFHQYFPVDPRVLGTFRMEPFCSTTCALSNMTFEVETLEPETHQGMVRTSGLLHETRAYQRVGSCNSCSSLSPLEDVEVEVLRLQLIVAGI